MNAIVPAVLLLLSLPTATTTTHLEGDVTVRAISSPRKALEFEVTIPAPVHDVWTVMSTADGLTTWLAPKAKVELRRGGDWLVMLGPSTGGGTIVDFTPEKRLSIRALAPDWFPTVRRTRTSAVFTLEALDENNTRLTLRQTGWKKGDEWDKAYAYLAKGNAMLLNSLRQRFVTGPTDWTKVH